MKILHIAPTPFFADRGCHIRILGEIRALQDLGHEILLTTYHHGRDVDGVQTARTVRVPWYTKLEAGPSWHKFYVDLFLLWRSMRSYLSQRPDIIHGHLHEGALIGWLVSRILSGGRTPVVFDVQGSLTGELDSHGFFNRLGFLRSFFRALEKIICRLPDRIVCNTESNARFITSTMGVPKTKVLSLSDCLSPEFCECRQGGVSKEYLGIPDGGKIVIYTGSLVPAKGVSYFLDAIPRIAERCGRVRFLIVGYPVEPSKARVRDLRVSELVHFTGKLDYSRLPEYLAVADVAVDPKVDAGGEGSGKIVHYVGAGLPIVCFDTVNNRAFLGEGAFYATPRDPMDLADRIIEALDCDCRMRATRQETMMESLSWSEGGKRLSQIYSMMKGTVTPKGTAENRR
jgi:glycosyltransferase involved in cell wall biosynthesis